MAKRYHVSADGVSRVCDAQTAESCRATGVDGGPAPHGEFKSAKEAQRFAEGVMEKASGGSFLQGDQRGPSAREIATRRTAELMDDLRDSVRDYRNPRTTDEERRGIQQFWENNAAYNQFQAAARVTDLKKLQDRISKVGRNPRADAKRFEVTTKKIEEMAYGIDVLGGQVPGEFYDTIQENDVLGESLGRESHSAKQDRISAERAAAQEAEEASRKKPRGLFGRLKS